MSDNPEASAFLHSIGDIFQLAYAAKHSVGESSGFYFRREDMPSQPGDVEVTVKICRA